MSPTYSKKLQASVEEVTEWKDEYKKEFSNLMNSMTKEEYAAKKLDVHIEDFAESKIPTPSAAVGGGGAEPAPLKEEVQELTYKELKELKNLKETDDLQVFRTKQGKLVTGPAEVSE
jgi:hydrogenase maturation factor HypE